MEHQNDDTQTNFIVRTLFCCFLYHVQALFNSECENALQVGGDPGIGKSTLLLQVAHMLAVTAEAGGAQGVAAVPAASSQELEETDEVLVDEESEDDDDLAAEGRPVLYISGEESKEQVSRRDSSKVTKANFSLLFSLLYLYIRASTSFAKRVYYAFVPFMRGLCAVREA